MKYIVAVVGILFLVGWATGAVPVDAMAAWAVIVILVAAVFRSRRRDRVGGLQRAVFYGGSLIGFKESVEDHPKGDPRHPGV